MYVMDKIESPTPQYDVLCQVIFGIPLTSSFVESLFSKLTYNQSKIRTRLKDTTMSSTLYLHDTELTDPQKSLSSALTLKVMIP